MLHTNKSEDKTKAENERPTASEYAVSFVAVSVSLASPFTIELANESITGQSTHDAAVIGARWTLNSGASSLESSGAKGYMIVREKGDPQSYCSVSQLHGR